MSVKLTEAHGICSRRDCSHFFFADNDIILHDLEEMIAGLGLIVMGALLPKKSTFPSGMKVMADYVHSKGLKLGIYSDAGHFAFLHLQQETARFTRHEEMDAKTFAPWELISSSMTTGTTTDQGQL